MADPPPPPPPPLSPSPEHTRMFAASGALMWTTTVFACVVAALLVTLHAWRSYRLTHSQRSVLTTRASCFCAGCYAVLLVLFQGVVVHAGDMMPMGLRLSTDTVSLMVGWLACQVVSCVMLTVAAFSTPLYALALYAVAPLNAAACLTFVLESMAATDGDVNGALLMPLAMLAFSTAMSLMPPHVLHINAQRMEDETTRMHEENEAALDDAVHGDYSGGGGCCPSLVARRRRGRGRSGGGSSSNDANKSMELPEMRSRSASVDGSRQTASSASSSMVVSRPRQITYVGVSSDSFSTGSGLAASAASTASGVTTHLTKSASFVADAATSSTAAAGSPYWSELASAVESSLAAAAPKTTLTGVALTPSASFVATLDGSTALHGVGSSPVTSPRLVRIGSGVSLLSSPRSPPSQAPATRHLTANPSSPNTPRTPRGPMAATTIAGPVGGLAMMEAAARADKERVRSITAQRAGKDMHEIDVIATTPRGSNAKQQPPAPHKSLQKQSSHSAILAAVAPAVMQETEEPPQRRQHQPRHNRSHQHHHRQRHTDNAPVSAVPPIPNFHEAVPGSGGGDDDVYNSATDFKVQRDEDTDDNRPLRSPFVDSSDEDGGRTSGQRGGPIAPLAHVDSQEDQYHTFNGMSPIYNNGTTD